MRYWFGLVGCWVLLAFGCLDRSERGHKAGNLDKKYCFQKVSVRRVTDVEMFVIFIEHSEVQTIKQF